MVRSIKDAEEKLGADKIEEIADKDWKVAELPSEEELASEETKHPKARNNPNSRANLIQYRKDKTKDQKKKMIKNLKYEKVEEDIDPSTILGEDRIIKIIDKIVPAVDILESRQEQENYYNYIKLILDDFDVEELTGSDIDDILTLAVNRVIENRLLKASKGKTARVLDISNAIDRFKKVSEKIKGGLASRRVDRVDLKTRPAFSIVDLAVELDQQDRADFDERIKKMEQERDRYLPPKRDEKGFIVRDDD